MKLIAKLDKPYTERQRVDFIVEYLSNPTRKKVGTETALEVWGLTEEEEAKREKQIIDSLTLTPADVERALYKAKGMDFEDLKALIAQQLPQVDIKGLAIEFRAKDFYRGAEAGGMRLFDVVGQLLGYTPADMDYLFMNKELPSEVA